MTSKTVADPNDQANSPRPLSVQGTRATKSILDEIQGVGPAKKRALLKKFGSVRGLRDATEADLAGVAGIGPALAERIKQAID